MTGDWSMICIDVKSFLAEIFVHNQKKHSKLNLSTEDIEKIVFDYSLNSVELCAKAIYKNVYTSDVQYTPKTMPKEMRMLLDKGEEFESKYSYRMIDNEYLIIPIDRHQPKSPPRVQEPIPQQNNLNTGDLPMIGLDFDDNEELEEEEDLIPLKTLPVATPNPLYTIPAPLQPSSRINISEGVRFGGDSSTKVLAKRKPFTLQPDPILSLTNRQGVDCREENILMYSNQTAACISGTAIVLVNCQDSTQRFLLGHEHDIARIASLETDNLLVSVEKGSKADLIFWRVIPARLLCRYRTDYSEVLSLDICKFSVEDQDRIHLAVSGKDSTGRDLITLFNITDYQNNEIEIFTKQIADFPITKLRYIDRTRYTALASCGRENICLWEVKNKFITLTPVNLNEHAQGTYFTDFSVIRKRLMRKEEKLKFIDYQYILYFVSSKGYMYIIDLDDGIMRSVLRLHNGAISSISISPKHDFLVTGAADCMVRVWTVDTSELMFDFRLESQITNLVVSESSTKILVSTLSGILGTIDIKNKLFKSFIRTHPSPPTSLAYTPVLSLLSSLSASSSSLRCWSLLGDSSGGFSQVFEFSYLDESATCVSSYNHHKYIIIGFASGLLRIFDVLEFCLVREIETPSEITHVKVAFDDQNIYVLREGGVLAVLDGKGEFRKDVAVGFEKEDALIANDYYGKNLVVARNPFTLFLFSAESLEVKQKISINEPVVQIKFSYLKDVLLVLTQSGNLKFYHASFSTVELFRDFSSLHEGGIQGFDVSLNCAYILTYGKTDKRLKIWDYNFRGDIIPVSQSFTDSTCIHSAIMSNDELGYIFSLSKDSVAVNAWKFKSSFVDMGLRSPAEELDKRDHQIFEIKNEIKQMNIAMPDDEDLLELPVATSLEVDHKHIVGDIYPIKNTSSMGRDENADNTSHREKTVRFSKDIQQNNTQEDKTIPAKDNSSTAQLEYKSSLNLEQEEYDAVENECIKIVKVYGNNGIDKCLLAWDTSNEYYLSVSTNKVLLTHFDEDESFMVLETPFLDPISYTITSFSNKYSVIGIDPKIYEPTCCISIFDGSSKVLLDSFRISNSEKILSIDISQKEDYLLVAYKPLDSPYSVIKIWEILNAKSLVESAINEEIIEVAWCKDSVSTHEFITLTKKNIYFWRLKRDKTLQFHMVTIRDLGGRIDNSFSCFAYFQIKDEHKSGLVIVGTDNGGLIFLDARSAAVIGYNNSLLPEPIMKINSLPRTITLVGSSSSNIYGFGLTKKDISSIEAFLLSFDLKPDILTFDGRIGSSTFPPKHDGMEGLVSTHAGTIWYVNWKERATIKLRTWHHNKKQILAVEVNNETRTAITGGTDSTIKTWSVGDSDESLEFYVPRTAAFCISSFKDIAACGFIDGTIRLYEVKEGYELGMFRVGSRECCITSLKILNNGLNILAGNQIGEIFNIRIESYKDLRVEIAKVVDLRARIWNIDLCPYYGLKTWLVSCDCRTVKVWRRKDIYQSMSSAEEDLIMKTVSEIEYYMMDNYSVDAEDKKSRDQTTYSQFSPIEPNTIISYTQSSFTIEFRNYIEHLTLPGFVRYINYKIWESEVTIARQTVDEKHKGPVTKLRFYTINSIPTLISASIDHTSKLWEFNKKTGLKVIQTLIGHTGSILDIDYSTDKDLIVSVSVDQTLRVWKQHLTKNVFLSPWFVESQTVKYNKDCIPTLKDSLDLNFAREATAHFSCITFMPDQLDSLMILVCDLLGNIHLFKYIEQENKLLDIEKALEKMNTDELKFYRSNMNVHRLMINRVHVSSSQNTAYTSSYDQMVCSFDLDTGKEFFKTENPNKTHFTSLYWHENGQELIASDFLGYIHFMNAKGEKENFIQRLFTTPIVDFDIVPEHNLLIICNEKEVKLFKINKGFQVQKLPGGHQEPVISMLYLDFKKIHGPKVKTPSKLISLGLDNTIRTWDSIDQTEIVSFEGPSDTEMLVMDYIPKYGLLVTGHDNGDLFIWDLEIGTKLKMDTKKLQGNTVCCLSHMSTFEYTYIFSAGYNGKIYVWELNEKKSSSHDTLVYPQLKMSFFGDQTLEREDTLGNELLTLACNERTCTLYAAGNSKNIYIINIYKNASYKHDEMLKGHTDSVNILIVDQNYLFSASDDETILMWELTQKIILNRFENHSNRINNMILNDGLLISTCLDNWVVIYDYPRDEIVHKFKKKVNLTHYLKGRISSIAYSPDNRCIFMGSESENILKINLDDFEEFEKG